MDNVEYSTYWALSFSFSSLSLPPLFFAISFRICRPWEMESSSHLSWPFSAFCIIVVAELPGFSPELPSQTAPNEPLSCLETHRAIKTPLATQTNADQPLGEPDLELTIVN